MTHSLYYKFIIGYLVFGLLGFITIATISSDMTYDFLLETKSDALYDEANMLAQISASSTAGRNSNLNELPQAESGCYLPAGRSLDRGHHRTYRGRQQCPG